MTLVEQNVFRQETLQFCAVKTSRPCSTCPKLRSAMNTVVIMQLGVISLIISLKALQDSTYLISNGPASVKFSMVN